jgi:prevent-host-death family protein
MKIISIRELHLETGRWVRSAGRRGARIVVTDRGRPVATLVPYAWTSTQPRLPDREREIRKLSRIDVDSGEIVSDMRDRGLSISTRHSSTSSDDFRDRPVRQ